MGERKTLVFCGKCGKVKHKPHWYFITYYQCSVCGELDPERERRYTKKPKNPDKRRYFKGFYCGCMGY